MMRDAVAESSLPLLQTKKNCKINNSTCKRIKTSSAEPGNAEMGDDAGNDADEKESGKAISEETKR